MWLQFQLVFYLFPSQRLNTKLELIRNNGKIGLENIDVWGNIHMCEAQACFIVITHFPIHNFLQTIQSASKVSEGTPSICMKRI